MRADSELTSAGNARRYTKNPHELPFVGVLFVFLLIEIRFLQDRIFCLGVKYKLANWQAVSLFIHSSKLRLPLRSTCWGIPNPLKLIFRWGHPSASVVLHLKMFLWFPVQVEIFSFLILLPDIHDTILFSVPTLLYILLYSLHKKLCCIRISGTHHIHFLFWNDSRIIKTFGFCKDGVLFFCLNTK